jgi:hypothetical protein
MFVSLFQIRRQHIFDPFHERADSARQIAPMPTHPELELEVTGVSYNGILWVLLSVDNL